MNSFEKGRLSCGSDIITAFLIKCKQEVREGQRLREDGSKDWRDAVTSQGTTDDSLQQLEVARNELSCSLQVGPALLTP